MSDTSTQSTTSDNGDTQGTKPDDGGASSGKTFSQDDITRIAAREKDEGKRAGAREALEALGFKSIDEAKEFKRKLDDAENEKLSEADRARKKAEEDAEKAEQERQAARKDRVDGWVETALARIGVEDDEDISLITRLIDVDYASATKEEVTEAVKQLKAKKPALFAAQDGTGDASSDDKDQGNGGRKPPASDPGKGPGAKKPEDRQSAVQSRLLNRHGSKLAKK